MITAAIVGLVAWVGAHPVAAAEKETLTYGSIDAVGWMEAEALAGVGEIVGASKENLLLAVGMTAYARFTTPPQLEDQYLVVRSSEDRVKHPSSGQSGYRIEAVGRLTVKSQDNEVFTVEITHSFDSIYRGDKIVPYVPGPRQIEVSKNYANIDGHIVALERGKAQAGEQQIVFLDKGSDQGIAVGNLFDIYRPADELDPAAREKNLPNVTYGRLMALKVTHQFTTALVIDAEFKIEAGARFRSVME